MKKELLEKITSMFECDTARISKPGDKLFLLVGWKRSTTDQKETHWEKYGTRIDFDYIEEKLVATGVNTEELIKDAEYSKRLEKKVLGGLFSGEIVFIMRNENFIKESNAPEKVKQKALEILPFLTKYLRFFVNIEKQNNSISFYFGNGKDKTINFDIYDEDPRTYINCDNLDTDESFYVEEPCLKALELAFSWLK